jgi:hypothetical protein
VTPQLKQEQCLAFDKWGICQCFREHGHEKNAVDRYAKVHSCVIAGTRYEWTGHGDGKAVS